MYSLPRHRAAQSMEPGRDPAAMVVKAQKRPSPVLPDVRARPRGYPSLPPKTSLQGVLGSSRFVSVLKRNTLLFYENTDVFIPTVAETSIGLAIRVLRWGSNGQEFSAFKIQAFPAEISESCVLEGEKRSKRVHHTTHFVCPGRPWRECYFPATVRVIAVRPRLQGQLQ